MCDKKNYRYQLQEDRMYVCQREKNPHCELHIANNKIIPIRKFKYLGNISTEDVTPKSDGVMEQQMFITKNSKIFRNRNISIETKKSAELL